MTTQTEADEACERACADAYAKALAKAYAEAYEACAKIRKAHEACADIRKAYDKAIKGELSNPISKKIIEQPAQQSAVRGEPDHVEDVLAMVEPKIGCVNHDCDKCKAAFVQEPVKWSDYEPDGLHHNKPAPEIAIADAYRAGVDSGIAAEREACAKVADGWSKRDDDVGAFIARGIRARGNT